jgi:outer membrane protein OmpA-like peptidoglycan-associated protein
VRPLIAGLAVVLLTAIAAAQDTAFRSVDIGFRELDIEFRTLDLVIAETEVAGETTDLSVVETETEIRIALSADVLFDFDKSDIRAEAAEALRRVATMLREHPDQPVTIEGHTDSKGSDAYNQALSEDRALSVRDWLAEEEGLDASGYMITGFGETRPAAPNEHPDGSDDPEGRQQNRRVEIVIGKQG